MILFVLFVGLLTITSIVVAMLGEAPERIGAATVWIIFAIGNSGHAILTKRFVTIDYVGLFADLIGFASFLYLAYFARRAWPIWAAALQLLSFVSHLIRAIDLHVNAWTYAAMRYAPTLGVILSVLSGALLCQWRRRSGAHVPPWTTWS